MQAALLDTTSAFPSGAWVLRPSLFVTTLMSWLAVSIDLLSIIILEKHLLA
jgi:hypothetical protein